MQIRLSTSWTGVTFCVLMILVSLALLPFQKKERGKGCGTLNENAEDYLFRAKWIRSFDIPFIYSFWFADISRNNCTPCPFNYLGIHGIRTRNSKCIKAFIIYFLYILALIGMFIGSIYLSASFSQFWIFLLAVVSMMCYIFIWIFDMGFIMECLSDKKHLKLEKKGCFKRLISIKIRWTVHAVAVTPSCTLSKSFLDENYITNLTNYRVVNY